MVDQQRSANRNHLEALRQVTHELGWHRDHPALLDGMLGRISAVFNAERIWLLYPCDPLATSVCIYHETLASSEERASEDAQGIPMSEPLANVLLQALRAKQPMVTSERLPSGSTSISDSPSMVMALHPRVGKPWLLGLNGGRISHPWTAEDFYLLQDVSLLVTAVLNCRMLHQSLHESVIILHKLLAHSPVEKDFLMGGLNALSALIGTHYAALAIFNDVGETEHFLYTGINSEEAKHIGKLPSGKGLLGVVTARNEVLRIDDISKDPRACGFPPQHPAMKSLLALPIAHAGMVRGRVYLCDKWNGEPFSTDDQLLSMSFTQSLVLLLENMRTQADTQRAEESLIQHERQLQAIFESSPDWLKLIDRDGTVLKSNVHGVSMVGAHTREQLVGRSIYDVIAVHDKEAYRALIDDVFSGESRKLDSDLIGFGDKRLKIETHAVPLRNSEGKITAQLAITRDITDRKKAEQALHMLAKSTAQRSGRDFLQDSARELAKLYDASHVSIGVYAGSSKRSIRTLAVYQDGVFKDNMTYDLEGTPIDDVLTGKCEFIRSKAALKYPDDPQVSGERARSHFGKPLVGTDNSPIGVVSVMANQPLRLTPCTAPVLGIFANRIAAELQRLKIEEALRRREYKYRKLFETARDVIFTISPEGKFTSLNSAFEVVTGFPRNDWLGKHYASIVHPDDLAKTRQAFDSTLKGKRSPNIEIRFLTQSGKFHYGEITNEPLHENNRVIGVLGIGRDITERKHSEEQLKLAASVFENSLEGVVITDANGTILRVNPAFSQVTGYRPAEVIGCNANVLKSGRHDGAFFTRMWNALTEYGKWQGEIWNRRKNGEIYPEWLTISGVYNDTKEVTHYISVFTDITDKKHSEQRIQQLAHYDPLTNLPNRRLFGDRLEQALVHAHRNGRWIGLLYLDLDRFKAINDSLGHTAGDQLLQDVAKRLQHCVRESDTVARLGGDEFTIILTDFHDGRQAMQGVSFVAEKVIHVISEPTELERQEVTVTTSIGAALFPQDGQTANELLQNADTAMYHVKAKGRNNFQFYSSQMNAKARERLRLENRLRRALERDEFQLYYQPQVDAESGLIAGLEALLRWHDPEKGIIPPGDFIPLAEETGLIIPIGEWVIRSACRQLYEWQQAGYDDLRISVNISPLQFQQTNLCDILVQAIADAGITPACLQLELTESILMRCKDSVMTSLNFIKNLGVSIALDDFGKGYSSLSYLKQLPLDTLKIDQSFVRGIPGNVIDDAIILAIITLAKRLKVCVIAEGVETRQQQEILRRHECAYMQGFLFSRPVPKNDVTGWLERGRMV